MACVSTSTTEKITKIALLSSNDGDCCSCLGLESLDPLREDSTTLKETKIIDDNTIKPKPDGDVQEKVADEPQKPKPDEPAVEKPDEPAEPVPEEPDVEEEEEDESPEAKQKSGKPIRPKPVAGGGAQNNSSTS